MGRTSHSARHICKYFVWQLFDRDGVFYADGRGNRPRLGKSSLGTRDRDEALSRLHELDLQRAIEHGLASEPRPTGADPTIADGWGAYLNACAAPLELGGMAESSQVRYRSVRKVHETFCTNSGVSVWSEVDRGSVAAFAKWRNRLGRAPRTVATDLNVIRAANRWLVDNDLLATEFTLRIGVQKFDDSDTYCFKASEVQAMRNHTRDTPGLHWLHPIIVTLSTSGMRIGELLGLQWRDVDLDEGVIRIRDERGNRSRGNTVKLRTTKGKVSRTLDVNPALGTVLNSMAGPRTGNVFTRPDGTLTYQYVLREFKRKVLKPLASKFPSMEGEKGFADARPHSFRHFFVSECFRKGVPEPQIMAWVGHRDSKIFARYRHLRPQDGQRLMNGLDFFGDNESGNPTAPAPEPNHEEGAHDDQNAA